MEITVPKSDDMLAGMNASATIIIDEKEDVLLIPAQAVTEEGNTSYVYTKQDEDGELSGKTEVETGSTDGQNVEITSGLSEGDTVYYQMGVQEESTGEEEQQENKMGGGMQGGQGTPPSGNMGGGRPQ